MAAKVMRTKLEGQKDITFLDTKVSITSSLSDANMAELDRMVAELMSRA